MMQNVNLNPRNLAETIVDETVREVAIAMRRNGWENARYTRCINNLSVDGTFTFEVRVIDYSPVYRIGGLVFDCGMFIPGSVVTTARREAVKLVIEALEAF